MQYHEATTATEHLRTARGSLAHRLKSSEHIVAALQQSVVHPRHKLNVPRIHTHAHTHRHMARGELGGPPTVKLWMARAGWGVFIRTSPWWAQPHPGWLEVKGRRDRGTNPRCHTAPAYRHSQAHHKCHGTPLRALHVACGSTTQAQCAGDTTYTPQMNSWSEALSRHSPWAATNLTHGMRTLVHGILGGEWTTGSTLFAAPAPFYTTLTPECIHFGALPPMQGSPSPEWPYKKVYIHTKRSRMPHACIANFLHHETQCIIVLHNKDFYTNTQSRTQTHATGPPHYKHTPTKVKAMMLGHWGKL